MCIRDRIVLVPISTPTIGVALFSSPNTGCLLMRLTVGLLPADQTCQVPGDQIISRNSCDICTHGHSGSEGHRVFSFLLEEHHENNSCSLSLIHISEPTRLGMISYAVFCLKKK